MALAVGDKIPDVTVRLVGEAGAQPVSTRQFFAGKRAVLFAVPGAFTPTCSDDHLPGFVDRIAEIEGKGVDVVACTAVNDAFVLAAWGKARGVGDKIALLADGNGDFARAVGLELDASGFGLGTRSKRYAAVLEDGVVKALHVEANPGQVTDSSADAILRDL
jgi:peroxiredoxin